MDTYEKKYNEALEKARYVLHTVETVGCVMHKDLLEEIFPELRESEDERIRDKIIWLLQQDICPFPDEEAKQMVAWLEKQKENPKSADSISADCTSLAKCEDRDSKYGVFPEDVIVVARACEKLEAHGYPELAHALKNVNLYTKEQKPVQSAEEKEFVRTIKSIIADFIRDKKPEDVGFYQQIYDWLDGRHIEQKPVEWSEEDEKMRLEAIRVLVSGCERYRRESGCLPNWHKTIDWLKSLRPAQDCSADCPKHLEGYISGRADAENELLEMYGILLMPDGELRMKPRWKPSEEQMKALYEAAREASFDRECGNALYELYDQLQKL